MRVILSHASDKRAGAGGHIGEGICSKMKALVA